MSFHIIDAFLDRATCRRIREVMDAGEVEPGEILDTDTAVDLTIRRVDLVEVDPVTLQEVERRLDGARETIASALALPLSGREGASFLRYPAGGLYLPHVDRAESHTWPAAVLRQVAVVLFLNHDFVGGWLHLIDGDRYAEPREGRLVAFDAGLLHEVELVRQGVRDVVVDWFY